LPGRIKVLDKTVSERIAAGEVVESPSSVVKELVENSVDAGAKNITVEIERGGKGLIRVSDNGEGIEKEDLKRAFLRHATSKIKDAGDIDRLYTLGFRGEALASIAAVSRIITTTRTKTSIEGTLYSMEGGRETGYTVTGCPVGTCVEVRDLFYNTPARLEFLKADSYEASQVNDIVTRLALARPDISFRLINNGRQLINTPGSGSCRDTIVAVYGKETMENLTCIRCQNGNFSIEGFISKPHAARSNRNFQSYFINGRYIKSRLLTQTLEKAYKTLLMVNRYPAAILYIKMDAEKTDVNVHPAKLEIRFRDEESIKVALFNCIKENLESRRWIAPGIKGDHPSPLRPLTKRKYINLNDSEEGMVPKGQNSHLSEETVEYNRIEMDNIIEGDSEKIPDMKIIGQFMCTFILAEGEECMYIIDQHAAHERIMYEQLTDGLKKGITASQQLLEPIVLDLSAVEMEALRANTRLLSKIGFEMEEFGISSIAVRAVPVFFGSPQSAKFLTDLAGELSGQRNTDNEGLKEDEIIKRACKSAVKANQRLSDHEMQSLLEQLKNTNMPFSCPHGRPVLVALTRYELEKMFKRIV